MIRAFGRHSISTANIRGRPLQVTVRIGSASIVARFYSATRDRAKPLQWPTAIASWRS
jgi:hypothetical protein